MIVTRFNPSCNGGLHLGHVYMALINERIAHEAGGKFVVRFDDCGEVILAKVGAKGANTISHEMIHDLSWLGIDVDDYCWQSEMLPDIHAQMHARGIEPAEELHPMPTPEWLGTAGERLMYPWAPRTTCEKVLMDYAQGVTLLIRGEDLLTEFSLYENYRNTFGLGPMRHVYLPQLVAPFGSIGKSIGGHQVAEMRANGWTAQAVRDVVSRSCLTWWANGWHLENIKRMPKLES